MSPSQPTAAQSTAILRARAGKAKEAMTSHSGILSYTVRRRRQRFEEQRIDGVGVAAKGTGHKS